MLEARNLLAGDLVIEWNNATLEAIRNHPASSNPGHSSRALAMVHTAVYDAVNAITKNHTSFALTTEAPGWASKEAAAATAARDVLVALFPQQANTFQSLWTQHLAAIPNGAAENAGVAIGHDAAVTVIAMRSTDGSADGSNYVITGGPGHWTIDPLHPDQVAWGPNWGEVDPMVMRYASDFSVPPPPSLTSQQYTDAYNEVKSLGALNSTTRTADQTEIGIFWGYDRPQLGSPTSIYNHSVQTIATLKGNSLEENARLFAMVNLALMDTAVATWKAKYEYDFWRPITAIRDGHLDGNPLTAADPNWVPLGSPGPDPNSTTDDFTPPFPAYTSGHSGFGASVFRTLANFYGSDQFNFSLTSEELPGVVRHYSSFSQAAIENGRSRIYLGVHWNFDDEYGQQIGNSVADYVFDHMFAERDDHQTLVQVQRVGGGYHAVELPAGTPIDVFLVNNSVKLVAHNSGEVLFNEPLQEVIAIRIDGRNNDATDFSRVIVGGGVVVPESLVIEVVGDEDWFDGAGLTTGDLADFVELDDQVLRVADGPTIHLYGIGYVDIGTHGGNDIIQVSGNQTGRQIDVAGYEGNDTYFIASVGADLYLSDTSGTDGINFSGASERVAFDLSGNSGQPQNLLKGVVRTWGDVEVLTGTPFNDLLLGSWTDDFIDGGAGDDQIDGRGGSNYSVGGPGDDRLTTAGNRYGSESHLHGGDGNDTYEISTHGGHVYVWDVSGYDLLDFSKASYYLELDLALANGQTQPSVAGNTFTMWGVLEQLTGSSFDDRLYGSDANDFIRGGAGNDFIDARGGTNYSVGEAGDDYLFVSGSRHALQSHLHGGDGNDVYDIGVTGGEVYVWDVSGFDYLNFERSPAALRIDLGLINGEQQPNPGAFSFYLWGDIEQLAGSQYSDRLYGTYADNFIYGLGGNDLIYGRFGNDRIYSGDGHDIVIGGWGDDTVYGGSGTDLLIGSQGMDSLYGESGDDLLIGGTTQHDFNEAALFAILAEWTSNKARWMRQANIQDGMYAGRLNGDKLLRTGRNATVFDDNEADTLFFGADGAWVFAFGDSLR